MVRHFLKFLSAGAIMDNSLILELEQTYSKCSDCMLHPDYVSNLNKRYNIELTKDLVDYLCDKIASKKHIWEIRFYHLRILLLNSSAKAFNLKDFYFERLIKCRRLALKIFFIRGYAIYATEEELIPVMEKFRKSLANNHDYIDYNYLLSVAGIPYLVDTYGYDCFVRTLEKAEEEHQIIDPLLHGFFTINEELE